jgi:hypothetical protein
VVKPFLIHLYIEDTQHLNIFRSSFFRGLACSLYFYLLGQNTKNRNKKDLSDPFLFRKEKGFAFFLSFCCVTSNGHTTKGKGQAAKKWFFFCLASQDKILFLCYHRKRIIK